MAVTRHWFCAYEIDIDADTPEEAAMQATKFVRDGTCIATWQVRSSESNQGEEMPELTGLVHMMPSGDIDAEMNEEIPCSD